LELGFRAGVGNGEVEAGKVLVERLWIAYIGVVQAL